MNQKPNSIRINERRFRERFDALSDIGTIGDGGMHRPALSEAHLQARRWFTEQAQQAGLAVHVDDAGNHCARLEFDTEAKTLLIGSHLDSVPQGGRFDGALGVVCGLEVLHTLKDAEITLPFNLEVVDFTDEEGAHVSLMGSRAMSGKLRAEDVQHPHSDLDAFETALTRAGLTSDNIFATKRDPASLAGYLEVHIEQGPRLVNAKLDIGVVTNIVGIRWFRLTFIGEANHSGTTPMDARRDAAQGACAFAVAAHALVMHEFPRCVVNVGQMTFSPGAFNVVPGRVDLALEFRAPETSKMQAMEILLLNLAREQGAQFGLDVQITSLEAIPPNAMHADAQRAIHYAAEILGLSSQAIHSGAGHDAQSFADLCPTGMIFIPSVDGISHSPKEFTHWQDCVNGTNVLLQTILNWNLFS